MFVGAFLKADVADVEVGDPREAAGVLDGDRGVAAVAQVIDAAQFGDRVLEPVDPGGAITFVLEILALPADRGERVGHQNPREE